MISLVLFYPKPESMTGSHLKPAGALSVEKDNSTGNHNWTLQVISCSDLLKVEDFYCYFLDNKGNLLIDGIPITELTGEVTFYDADNNGNLTQADYFYILGEPYGNANENYTLRLKWKIVSFSETILK